MESISVLDFGSGISVNVIKNKGYALNLYGKCINTYNQSELKSLIEEIESYGIKVNPLVFEQKVKREI